MTTKADDTIRIQSTLREYADADFETASRELLNVMGYRSERAPAMSGDVADFITTFAAPTPDTKTERAFREHAQSVKVIFQVSDAEIAQSVQPDMFDAGEFDKGRAQSFVFVAVKLKGEEYPRGEYAQFVREINKRFPMPIVALFRAASGKVTLAFVNRRVSKRDAERDVLGNVSLIREIEPRKPHRAHLDILSELSLSERLKWMDSRDKQKNFDGLLEAWLDALDTEELNKRFYKELFGWFERATKQAKFPTTGAKVLPAEEHIIRLITRMLFVWFVKEKRLIAADLFNEAQVSRLLRNYDRDKGDSYYRAVLQNLFFATLNTEIDRRGFSSRAQRTHRDFSRYRYKSEIEDADRLLELFRQTPFINGGLFDCLDTFDATGKGGYRIDHFTDNSNQRRGYSIPNRLFFGDDGLIDLFDRYKFTVEENTPAEQEVALDPELLGKVFENLLAAYNPETRDAARKQTARRRTGSYYTPRVVVDYMVDEALVASLSEKVQPQDGDKQYLSERLRYLLDYADAFGDADTLFTEAERDEIVRAIAEIKILDPAVGSGAFPMSMLHKLTLALRRLDERNEHWEALQKKTAAERAAAAFDTDDQQERENELTEISATFEKYRDSDFGRKLYLIQNSIFGVDIQPVATQIAKLRFFISLAIEQYPDFDADNLGIRPLPNLETRFVAADTLLGLKDANRQLTLGQTAHVDNLQHDIDANRERHFHANTRNKKNECRNEDKRLRQLLADALRDADFDAADAAKIAEWDPYDQNTSADWFDAEYMFGVADGFDMIIGNPPYVQLQRDNGRLGRLYKDAGYQTFARTGDIYQLFYERGMAMAKPSTGLLAYITSNSWLKAEYGKKTRHYFAEKHTPLALLELGKDVFESAIVDSSVMLMREGRLTKAQSVFGAVDMETLKTEDIPPPKHLWRQVRTDGEAPWSILSRTEQGVIDKMYAVGTPLKEWDIEIYRGITTGLNDAFIIDNRTKEALVAEDPRSSEIIKPVLRGQDIRRYQADWAGYWLIDTHNGYDDVSSVAVDDYPAVKEHLDGFYSRLERRYDKGRTPYNLRNCAYHANFQQPKLFWADMAKVGRFAFSERETYCNNKGYILTGESLKYLCAVLNSSLITWWVANTAATTGMGLTEWTIVTVERLPIPKVSIDKQGAIVGIVDRILEGRDSETDVRELEGQIDRMVYSLYGLTPAEIASI